MILDIQQTKSNFNMEWVITERNGTPFSKVVAPFHTGKFEANAAFSNLRNLLMYYNPYDNSWGSKLTDRLSFKILENGNFIGSIIGRTQKVGFLKSYPYYELTLNGQKYYAYEVGFGKNGLYLCIYSGNQLIAIVDKALRVINYKDSYTAYIEDPCFAEIVSVFTIYYDVTAYGDLMQIALLSVSEKRVNTIQKDLINKYDPTFIPKIKARHGIVD